MSHSERRAAAARLKGITQGTRADEMALQVREYGQPHQTLGEHGQSNQPQQNGGE